MELLEEIRTEMDNDFSFRPAKRLAEAHKMKLRVTFQKMVHKIVCFWHLLLETV